MSNKRSLSVAQGEKKESKKFECTLHDKITILDWHHKNGSMQSKTVDHFQKNGFARLKQPSLSKWISKEAEIRNQALAEKDLSVKRVRAVDNPEFEKAMSIWVDQLEENEFNGLTGEVIRQVAIKFYDKLGVPEDERLKLSDGWLEKFKARQALKFVRFHGEAGSVDAKSVELERLRLNGIVKLALSEGYSVDDMYNMDETSFFYAATPDQGLAREARSGGKQ